MEGTGAHHPFRERGLALLTPTLAEASSLSLLSRTGLNTQMCKHAHPSPHTHTQYSSTAAGTWVKVQVGSQLSLLCLVHSQKRRKKSWQLVLHFVSKRHNYTFSSLFSHLLFSHYSFSLFFSTLKMSVSVSVPTASHCSAPRLSRGPYVLPLPVSSLRRHDTSTLPKASVCVLLAGVVTTEASVSNTRVHVAELCSGKRVRCHIWFIHPSVCRQLNSGTDGMI